MKQMNLAEVAPEAQYEHEIGVLSQMARSGVPIYAWNEVLGPLIEKHMMICLDNFCVQTKYLGGEGFETKKAELRNLLRSFDNAPFTLQRVCELLLDPRPHYKSVEALLRGFEILLSVTSTIPIVEPDEVIRLEKEYQRVVATAVPGALAGADLRRTDTVEMDTVEMEIDS